MVAIVVGGAECFADDVAVARDLCEQAGATISWYAVNDQIATLPEDVIAVTLHPGKAKLERWREQRNANGLPTPIRIWASPENGLGLSGPRDSGLVATLIARADGHDRVILCGVPMSVEARHFVRHVRWTAAHGFRRAWRAKQRELAPYVRSCSGWTAETFGKPTPEFLMTSNEQQPPGP